MKEKISLKFSFDVILISISFIVMIVGYLNLILHGLITAWLLLFILTFYETTRRGKITFKQGSLKGGFPFLILFICVVFFSYLLLDTNGKSKQYVLIFINFAIVYLLDAYSQNNIDKKFTVIYLVVLALGIQALISIPYILSSEYMLIRKFSSGQLTESEQIRAIKNGIGNNGLYTSLSSLSLFALVFQQRLKSIFARAILIICALSMVFTVFSSTFFASILMFIGGLVGLMFVNFRRFFTPKILLLFIVLMITGKLVYDVFLSETNLLYPVMSKIERLQSPESGDVSAGRGDLANVSLNTFLDNPLFGVGVPDWRSYDIIGEHMPWIDFFANYGVLGFLPFLVFLFKRIKYRFRDFNFSSTFDTVCLIGVLIIFASNFISPMLTTPITYISLIFIYTSNSFRNA